MGLLKNFTTTQHETPSGVQNTHSNPVTQHTQKPCKDDSQHFYILFGRAKNH